MCHHVITYYPFCGCPTLEVTARDAVFILDGHDRNMCTGYTFYPCTRTRTAASLCVPWRGNAESYQRQIKARSDTIILVSLGDCGLGSRNVMGGCKSRGAQRAARDSFGALLEEEMVRGVKRGAEEEMQRCVFVRERNEELLEVVERRMGGGMEMSVGGGLVER
ncbi:uncharacterized protein H6S33_010941 [Morchella sextelata]|uniref:uncharacterized protein n=1 Tax=Morchella sextelata TaxID=1174677 RepID=UPI001D04329D|nr:uncharacterized protein H6S33_010941 [Morchella sextelata]KAH0611676.1 hypothetical protein H6S33_010941 [Morchella sextelata]